MSSRSPVGQGTCPVRPPEELPGLQPVCWWQHPPLEHSTLSPHSPSEPALCQQQWAGRKDPGALNIVGITEWYDSILVGLTSSVS